MTFDVIVERPTEGLRAPAVAEGHVSVMGRCGWLEEFNFVAIMQSNIDHSRWEEKLLSQPLFTCRRFGMCLAALIQAIPYLLDSVLTSKISFNWSLTYIS